MAQKRESLTLQEIEALEQLTKEAQISERLRHLNSDNAAESSPYKRKSLTLEEIDALERQTKEALVNDRLRHLRANREAEEASPGSVCVFASDTSHLLWTF